MPGAAPQASEVIEQDMEPAKRVHFVGIGGAGMSAIARVLLEHGVRVSGSDIEQSATTRELRALGAVVHIGHSPDHVAGADVVVLSTAIAPDNPEALKAMELGIPVKHRSEMLAELMNLRRGIAIAGAHGKTTITSMTAWTLARLGYDPTYLIGGAIPGFGGARAGGGPLLVAEADESDRSFLRYKPYVALISSIEPDHLEHYNGSFDELKAAYKSFAGNVVPQGARVLCIDDPAVRELAAECAAAPDPHGRAVITYGLSEGARYRAAAVSNSGFFFTFQLVKDGGPGETFRLAIPGRHNVQNALGCIAILDFLGVDLEAAARELAAFTGAKRRFQVVANKGGVLFVDDYAHHPSEIKATLAACRQGWPGRVIAVFQPHRYSRTSQLMEEFAQAFDQADVVVLTEVYAPPPEAPIPGVSGERLFELTRRRLGERVHFAPSLPELADAVRALARPGDIVVTMGAGNVWKVAYDLAEVAAP